MLENARLLEEERARQRIEEELGLARRIQQSLLPRQLPETGWFRVCGSSLPSHQVGGDYYDAVEIAPGTWSLVVADVAGKGVSSALLASFLQGAFLGAAAGISIADMLTRINSFMSDRAEHGKYATIFYARLHADGELEYANAGHCAPLVVGRGRPLESLAATSMPVGLMPEAPFTIEKRRLTPGDRLVLYSDGVTEAQNEAGEFFGRQRLRDAVMAAGELNCNGMHDAVQEALRGFTGGTAQSDDVTLLVAEFGAGV